MDRSTAKLYSLHAAADKRGRARLSPKRMLETQLARGFLTLRFKYGLEADFRDYLHQSGQYSRAALVLVAFFSVLVAVVIDNRWLGLPADLIMPTRIIQLGVLLPLISACGLVLWWRPVSRVMELLLLVFFVGVVLAILFQRALYSQYGYDLPAEFFGLTLVAMFGLARIRFWAMLAATTIATVAMALNEWLLVASMPSDNYHLFAVALMVIFGIMGGYSFEYLLRWTWLNGTLLRYLSRLDSLTGLLNRYALEDALARSRAHARRERTGYGLAMVDIDAFGAYNDHYGHQRGDVALRRVAGVLNAYARRPQDVCGRYGGEEFVVLWTDGSGDELYSLACQARARVKQLAIEHAVSNVADSVTVSIGLCYVSAENTDMSLKDGLATADRMVYRAKAAGRDQVVYKRV